MKFAIDKELCGTLCDFYFNGDFEWNLSLDRNWTYYHVLNLADGFDPKGIIRFYGKSKLLILMKCFWSNKVFCYFSFKSEGFIFPFQMNFKVFLYFLLVLN